MTEMKGLDLSDYSEAVREGYKSKKDDLKKFKVVSSRKTKYFSVLHRLLIPTRRLLQL